MNLTEEKTQFQVDEYITAIVWSPDGTSFVVATADGEIVQITNDRDPWTPRNIQKANGLSINALAFSANGQYLAAAGQAGRLYLWEWGESLESFDFPGCWIETLSWHPSRSQLAFGIGKAVGIWNGETKKIETKLDFKKSSVLDLAWSQDGDRLAVAGNQMIHVYLTQNWSLEPSFSETSSACNTIAWAPEDAYFAAGCFDQSVLVYGQLLEGRLVNGQQQFGIDDPWRMSGFPVKVSQVAWSSRINPNTQEPILATVSGEGVVLWNRTEDNWAGTLAVTHEGRIQAIDWHPKKLQLIAAGKDGQISIWNVEDNLKAITTDIAWSTIAWSPTGHAFVTGSDRGIIQIWNGG